MARTAHEQAAQGAPKGMSHIDPDLVHMLRTRLPAQTSECVMATLGISMNTWVKVRDGQPIRASVAQRLVQRFGAIG